MKPAPTPVVTLNRTDSVEPGGRSPHPFRVFGLDLIRAVAILLVMLAHTLPTSTLFGVSAEVDVQFRAVCGMMGVNLFFVPSGFLIGGILLRAVEAGRFESGRDVLHFWRRRWLRTLPLFGLFLVGLLLCEWRETGRLPEGWWRFLTFTQGFARPHPVFFRAAWSLAVEEWFYLLFPLSLLAARKIWRDEHRAFLVAAGLFLVVPTVLRGLPFASDFESWHKVTLLRLDAIIFGVLLVYGARRGSDWWAWAVRLWPAGLAGVLGVIGYLSFAPAAQAVTWLVRSGLFTFTALCLCTLVGAASRMRTPRAWLARPIVSISLWSYSLYLSHGVVNAYARPLLKLLGGGTERGSLPGFAFIWAVSFTISALLYRFFEQPLMNLRRPETSAKPSAAAAPFSGAPAQAKAA